MGVDAVVLVAERLKVLSTLNVLLEVGQLMLLLQEKTLLEGLAAIAQIRLVLRLRLELSAVQVVIHRID